MLKVKNSISIVNMTRRKATINYKNSTVFTDCKMFIASSKMYRLWIMLTVTTVAVLETYSRPTVTTNLGEVSVPRNTNPCDEENTLV